jgi:hypothetical protein
MSAATAARPAPVAQRVAPAAARLARVAATCDKTCAEAITNGNPVCADSTASLALYDALAACSCDRGAADTPAGCKDDCGDNLCVNKDATQACKDCVQKAACSADFSNCANDI